MSDTFRIQYGADGQEVNTTLDQAMRQDTPAPAPAPRQTSVMRGKYNTETGEFTLEENRPTGMNVAPAVEQATARNAQGMPISLSNVKPSDVVTLPGMGDSSAEVFESMGLLRRLPGGMGYEVVGSAVTTPADQPKQEQKKVEDQPAGDVTGVPGTSQEVDAFQADLAKRSPVGFDGLLTSLVKTGEMPAALVEDLARQSGQDSAEFSANVQRMTGEYVAAGRSALSNVGVTQPEIFEQWARAEQPDAFDNAVRDLVGSKSVARMQDLGRRFVEQNNTKLASLIQGHGVDAEVRDGQVWVSRKSLGLPPTPKVGDFGGNDQMSLRDAIRAGYISFSN